MSDSSQQTIAQPKGDTNRTARRAIWQAQHPSQQTQDLLAEDALRR